MPNDNTNTSIYIDADGCLLHSQLSVKVSNYLQQQKNNPSTENSIFTLAEQHKAAMGSCPILSYNHPLIDFIQRLPSKHIRIGSFSVRQTLKHDFYCAKFNSNYLFTNALPCFITNLQTKFSNDAIDKTLYWNKSLFGDLAYAEKNLGKLQDEIKIFAGDQGENVTFSTTTEELSARFHAATSFKTKPILDESKLLIVLYNALIDSVQISLDTTSEMPINLHFFDDRTPLLRKIFRHLKDAPRLLPPNIFIHLHPYGNYESNRDLDDLLGEPQCCIDVNYHPIQGKSAKVTANVTTIMNEFANFLNEILLCIPAKKQCSDNHEIAINAIDSWQYINAPYQRLLTTLSQPATNTPKDNLFKNDLTSPIKHLTDNSMFNHATPIPENTESKENSCNVSLQT